MDRTCIDLLRSISFDGELSTNKYDNELLPTMKEIYEREVSVFSKQRETNSKKRLLAKRSNAEEAPPCLNEGETPSDRVKNLAKPTLSNCFNKVKSSSSTDKTALTSPKPSVQETSDLDISYSTVIPGIDNGENEE